MGLIADLIDFIGTVILGILFLPLLIFSPFIARLS